MVGFCLLLGILRLCLGTGDICNTVGLLLSFRLFLPTLLFGGGRPGGVVVHVVPTPGGALFHSLGIGSVSWDLQHFLLLIRTILTLGISCGLPRPTVWLPSLGYQPWSPVSQSHFHLSCSNSPLSLPVISYWGDIGHCWSSLGLLWQFLCGSNAALFFISPSAALCVMV